MDKLLEIRFWGLNICIFTPQRVKLLTFIKSKSFQKGRREPKIQQMKLLIVEDEKTLSDSIHSYLTQESFICEVAGSYASALEKIELYDYDCILLDINLQDGNGLELLATLKDNRKSDGVLIISARFAIVFQCR